MPPVKVDLDDLAARAAFVRELEEVLEERGDRTAALQAKAQADEAAAAYQWAVRHKFPHRGST